MLLGDLSAAVCVLAAAPHGARPALAQQLIVQAVAAHRFMKRFGRAHAQWGSGTLAARAATMLPRAPLGFDLGDAQILSALAVLAQALSARKLPCLAARAPHMLTCA